MTPSDRDIGPEDRVYREIKRAIVTQVLPAGSQLVELRLAERFGVSRTPIRNALRRLAYEGLVKMVPNNGAFIAEMSASEIEQVYRVREVLEGFAARLASAAITPEELDRLERLLEEEEKACLNQDFEAYVSANDAIHGLIADASRNEVLATILKSLLDRSNLCLIFYDSFFGLPIEEVKSIKEHHRLLEALRTKNPEDCESEMRNQIKSAFEHLNLNYLRLREMRAKETW
jgi:DNA-binding GntR family transcriptional regulator